VNTAQVEALRALLAPSGWLERTRYFARALHSQTRTPQGLLVIGTPTDEPWHMTAHLADESRLMGLAEMEPTLVRWSPPADAPPHLRVGMERLERAGRNETLLVVSSQDAPGALLERVADARKAGTSIFALDRGDPELDGLAHESLAVQSAVDPVSFDGAQHLVSMALGEVAAADSRSLRRRLASILDTISGPQQLASGAVGSDDEGSAALPGDDQAAVPQHLHGVPDRLVRDFVLLGQGALGGQLVGDLADLDPGRDVVGDLDVGEIRPERVYHRHVINVGTLVAA
jgi:hypothetical protein